ncbi:MAG: AhpC/TSA family protein [Candidatus Heimdallarchaeota archaeon]|nr:AhpC/TSA family protein [Candidatus Heimdallarchaeota archaeon]
MTEQTSEPTPRDVIKEFNHNLTDQGIAEGLKIGEKAPDFLLKDKDGIEQSLQNYLAKGPLVISFYRGDWCTHCSRELNDLNDHYDNFKNLGVEIVAIAPQNTGHAKEFQTKFDFKFPLLSDPDFATINQYKLKFMLSQEIQNIYSTKFNLDLPNLTASGTWELPVPATYLVDQLGIIRFRFADKKYWVRLEATELLETIKKIIVQS